MRNGNYSNLRSINQDYNFRPECSFRIGHKSYAKEVGRPEQISINEAPLLRPLKIVLLMTEADGSPARIDPIIYAGSLDPFHWDVGRIEEIYVAWMFKPEEVVDGVAQKESLFLSWGAWPYPHPHIHVALAMIHRPVAHMKMTYDRVGGEYMKASQTCMATYPVAQTYSSPPTMVSTMCTGSNLVSSFTETKTGSTI